MNYFRIIGFKQVELPTEITYIFLSLAVASSIVWHLFASSNGITSETGRKQHLNLQLVILIDILVEDISQIVVMVLVELYENKQSISNDSTAISCSG